MEKYLFQSNKRPTLCDLLKETDVYCSMCVIVKLVDSLQDIHYGGWVNRPYSRLSTTHGHITDCKLGSVVDAGVYVVIFHPNWTFIGNHYGIQVVNLIFVGNLTYSMRYD